MTLTKILKFLTTVTLLSITQICAQSDCKSTFVISRDTLPKQPKSLSLLKKQPLNSFAECLKICSANHKCDFVRFDTDEELRSQSADCLTFSRTLAKSAIGNEAKFTNVVYFAEKTCLKPASTNNDTSTDCKSTWQYERHSGIALRNIFQTFILRSSKLATITECLNDCTLFSTNHNRTSNGANLNNGGHSNICRAVGYSTTTNECQLLAIAPNSVREVDEYFVKNQPNTMAVYERACTDEIILSSRKCDFLPMRGSAMLSLYDERIASVINYEECERICTQWTNGPICRSYTYDSRARECYISHASSVTAQILHTGGKRLTMRSDDMIMGDLDDCIDFTLRCQQDAMIVRGRSLRLLNANVKPRAVVDSIVPVVGRLADCQLNVYDTFEFQTRINYDVCGTKKETDASASYYSNTLFLKDAGTELVTIRDKMVSAMCKITLSDDLSVKYHFNVDGNGTEYMTPERRTLILSTGIQAPLVPLFSLDVLDSDNIPTNEVTAGDVANVVVSVQQRTNPEEVINFHVSDMVAEDGHGNVVAQLYDEDGCPVNKRVSDVLVRQVDGRVYARIHTNEMGVNADRLTFRALVQPCAGKCPEPCTHTSADLPSLHRSRHRRSTIQPDSLGRNFYLSEENFVVQNDIKIRVSRSSGTTRGARRLNIGEINVVQHGPIALDEEIINSIPTGVPQVREYSVSGRRDSNRITRLTESLNYDNDESPFVHLESPTTLQLCMSTQKFTCIFTGLLVLLQLILISLCAIVVYMYWQYVTTYSQRFIRSATQWRCRSSFNEDLDINRPPPPKYSDVVMSKELSDVDSINAPLDDESSSNLEVKPSQNIPTAPEHF